MKPPIKFLINTPEFIKLQSLFILMVATYGCDNVKALLEFYRAKAFKKDDRHAGAFLIAKICEEYQITEYEFQSSDKRGEVVEARHIFCILSEVHLGMTKEMASAVFGKSKHFGKRAFKDTYKRIKYPSLKSDIRLKERFERIETRLRAYLAFQPKTGQEPKDNAA